MENEKTTQDIDYLDILKTIINGKKKIFIFLFIFTVLGLFVALLTPNKYSSSTIFVSQGSSGNAAKSNLGGLAAIAGINIGQGAEESGISLSLYSEIINSIPFQKELIEVPLTIKDGKYKVSYKEYYSNYRTPSGLDIIKKYSLGLPNLILSVFKNTNKEIKVPRADNNDVITISEKEKKLFDQLENQISLKVSDIGNAITITSVMPEAIHAAELTSAVRKLLEKYIIDLKVMKSVAKLSFIKKRFIEKEKNYKTKQRQLANYQDRNKFSSSQRSQSMLISLQSEYELAFNVFNQLAIQVETQEIVVKENTPIFTVIQPVSVPLHKFGPKRLNILLTWMLSGVFIAVLLILVKKYYKEFKNKIIITEV